MDRNRINPVLILILIAIIAVGWGCTEKVIDEDFAVLSVSVDSLSAEAAFGFTSPPTVFLYVTSEGTREVTFSYENKSNWLKLFNPFFNGVAPDSFLVRYVVSGLPEGVYHDTIVITSDADNNRVEIPVRFKVGTEIKVDPISLNFIGSYNGVAPMPQYVKATSTSGNDLSYMISTPQSWLHLDRTEGQTSIDDSIEVGVLLGGLPVGTYYDSIQFFAPDAFNGSVSVPVTLTISSWISQSSPLIHDINGVVFENEMDGWAVGSISNFNSRSGFIIRTTDGGMNWEQDLFLNSPVMDIDSSLGDVMFVDGTGWATGADGILLKRTSQSQTWTAVSTPLGDSINFNALFFSTADLGCVVGDNGKILYTYDGGQSWQMATTNTSENINDVHFIDNMSGWAVGQKDLVLVTTNGGLLWQPQQVATSPIVGSNYDLRAVHFTDNLNGWAIGKSSQVITTSDGGSSWSNFTAPLGKLLNFSDIYFYGPDNGWIVGDSGTILATHNGGQTWEEQFSGTNQWLFSAFFLDENIGWVTGTNGTIRFSSSGGN